jgi:hypothetical protein
MLGSQADWTLVGSQKALDELSRTRDGALRDALLRYALGFVDQDPDDEDRRFAADFGRRLINAPFIARYRTWPTAN